MGPDAVIQRIIAREYLARAGRVAALAATLTAASAAVALTACRLLGGPAGWCSWPLLAAPAVIAVAAGLMWARRPGRRWAARQFDGKTGGDDLIATWIDLGTAPGAYQTIVREQAEAAAMKADPRVIRPWRPRVPALRAAAALAALALAVGVVPLRDPFGLQAERHRIAEREQVLAAKKAEAKAHAADLRAQDPEKPVSDGAAESLAKLTATLDALKTAAPAGANQQALAQAQKLLANELLAAQSTVFKPETSDDQNLGGPAQQAGKKLADALAAGDAQSLAHELAAMRQAADRLAAAKDPAAQDQARQELQKQLENLQQTLGRSNTAAGRTVQDALDQLALAGNPKQGGSQAAQEALQASLDLLDAQMQTLARGARDAQALKDALATERMARQLDQMGGLADAGKPLSLAEYTKKYREVLDKMKGRNGKGDGKGEGGGESGDGGGGKVDYNDNADTGFTPERSPGQMGPGEILMQWKTIGPSEPGKVDAQYQAATNQVRQEASEALMHEDLPPSAREAAKRYFDGMAPAAAPTAPTTPTPP